MEPTYRPHTHTGDFEPLTAGPESNSGFVRELAHGMRQPLSVIESAAYYTNLILEQRDPRILEQLEKIQGAVQRINAMLSDLLIHQEAGMGAASSVSLTEAITDAVTDLRAREGVQVEWQAPLGGPVVPLTATLAEQLVRNAVNVFGHLCGKSHPVTVSLKREEGRARMECVTETVDYLWRRTQDIFTPFSPLVPGEMGLAMAAVRRIAEACGGSAQMDPIDSCRVRLSVELPAR